MDSKAIKANQQSAWSAAAAGSRTYDAELQAHLGPMIERMVAMLRPGQRVLDVCSGSGEPALSAARRVLPGGEVIGIDIAEKMLEVAQQLAVERGVSNVKFRPMDAELLDFPAGHFDAAIFQFGLMFLPDPGACLTRLRHVLKPGAPLSVSCWADAKLNPWVTIPGRLVRQYVTLPPSDPDSPGPFAFADRERLSGALTAAGFSRVNVEPIELVMSDFETGAAFVVFSHEMGRGMLRTAREKLAPERYAALSAEIAHEAEQAGGGRAFLKGTAWLATATA